MEGAGVVDVDHAVDLHGAGQGAGGGRGVHLYLLWQAEQDAFSVRSWLADVLAGLKRMIGEH